MSKTKVHPEICMKTKERMTRLADDVTRFVSEIAECPRNLYGFLLPLWRIGLSDGQVSDRLPEVSSGPRHNANRISKMKVHPEICMKTKDEDKMSFGEQAWMLARCKGEADCA
jgi:hypothetical protein